MKYAVFIPPIHPTSSLTHVPHLPSPLIHAPLSAAFTLSHPTHILHLAPRLSPIPHSQSLLPTHTPHFAPHPHPSPLTPHPYPTPQAVSASRALVMDQYDLSADPCDNRLINFNNCIQVSGPCPTPAEPI